jgi:HK97 family phage prohead protease
VTTTTTETRSARITEFRELGDGRKGFTARVVNYGVRDTYGTSWTKGVFNESLDEKLPPVVWCHDWSDPIGRVVAYREFDDGLEIDVELDDFEAVPRARQAYAQLQSGTMKEFSFAFTRADSKPDQNIPNTIQITKAGVDEFSVVLVGSVPGTHTVSMRAKTKTVPATRAAALVTRLARGDIDLNAALAALDGGRMGKRAPVKGFEIRAVEVVGGQQQDDVDPMAVLAQANTAVAALGEALDGIDIKDARKWFQQAANFLWEISYLLGMQPGYDYYDDYWFYSAPESEKRGAADQTTTEVPDDEQDIDAQLQRMAVRGRR